MLTALEALRWCERMGAVVGFSGGGVRLLVAEHTIWKNRGGPQARHNRPSRDEGDVMITSRGAYTDIVCASFEMAVESAIPFWIGQIGLVDALALLADEEI